MTQEELANALGVSNKTISRWERGINMPDILLLKMLSKEFDVTITDLLNGGLVDQKDIKKIEETLIDYTDLKLKKMTTKAKVFYLVEEICIAIISVILGMIFYQNLLG